MFFRVIEHQSFEARSFSFSCPRCQEKGTFDVLGTDMLTIGDGVVMGHRACPTSTCRMYMLVIYRPTGQLLTSFPALTQAPPKTQRSAKQSSKRGE